MCSALVVVLSLVSYIFIFAVKTLVKLYVRSTFPWQIGNNDPCIS